MLYYAYMTRKSDKNNFIDTGNQIREAREKLGMTQAQVAEKAGVNISYYAEIERGEVNPSLAKLQSIMKVVKIKTINLT